jgi:hypothetical protein
VFLDGTNAPTLSVLVAFGGQTTVDPEDGYLVLGAGVLNTDVLGDIGWVDVTADARAISIQGRGQSDEIGSAGVSTCSIVLDNVAGAYDPLNTAGPYYGQVVVGVPVWVQASWAGTDYPLYRGYVDVLDLDAGNGYTVTLSCTDGLETLGRAKLAAITSSFDGDATGARIGRILDAAQWPSALRSLDTGQSDVQATTYGDYALPLIQQVVDSELGLLYVDASGQVVFYDRLHVYTATRSTTVQAALTDSGDDVDMVDLTVSMSRATVFNEARLTRDGGTEQVASDATSQTQYGLRTFPSSAGTLLRSDADVLSMASWLVGRFRDPKVEVSQVRIDATAQGVWADLLPLTIYDRISVERDYGPSAVAVELLIQGMSVEISDAGWTYVLSTRNTDAFSPMILGTGLLGTGQLA